MSFEQFAKASGLIVDRAIPDGRIHRVPTLDKSSKRNGAYKWNGEFGWCQDWQSMDGVSFYKADKPLDPISAERAKKMARSAMAERQNLQRSAAQKAQEIIGQCGYDSHPYFAAKGLAGERGLIDPAGNLVVPMRHWRTQDLQSVQTITAQGEKKFLPDGRAKAAVFALGPRAGDAWLCEGYATGLSVQQALKSLYRSDRVIVCFSAGNLRHVADQIGPCRVVADNDAADRNGRQAGQEAAQASGKPWVMSPVQGEDANDMARRAGVRAVAELMRSIL